MLAPISGEMNFVPPPRKKSVASSPDEPVRFDEVLIERLEAIDRDAASREDSGGRGEKEETDSDSAAGEDIEAGTQGSGPQNEAAPVIRRIDLRA
ncbi:hypothetical protein LLH00_10170 [bacterium]|nr:hypothetical protein [bacterium]